MTAAAHVSSFRSHIHPEQVGSWARHKMAHELMHEQVLWSTVIILTCAMFSFTTIVAFRNQNLPILMQVDATQTAAIACAAVVGYLHIHFSRQRRFIREAPATTAIVVREEQPPHFDGESSMAVPRLFLRYLPRPGSSFDLEQLQSLKDACTKWVELDGFSGRFERSVRPGDLVTILYDPKDHGHVRVVEIERNTYEPDDEEDST